MKPEVEKSIAVEARFQDDAGVVSGSETAPQSTRRTCRLLGTAVDIATVEDLMWLLRTAHLRTKPTIVANINLHAVFLYHRNEEMRRLHEVADLVCLDSVPLVFWARLLGLAVSRRHRVTFLDYKERMFAEADELSWRVFYLGGKPGVATRAAGKLTATYKNMTLHCHHGYLETAADNERVIAQIREFRPQIVLVGMGMPLQEEWIFRNYRQLPPAAWLVSGAAFDYVAGEIPTSNRWLGAIGLEWLCRLCSEPKRLSYRYLIEPWFLLPYVARDLLAYRLGMASRDTTSLGGNGQ